jgi:16S rRNA (cytosine967-C5)-methyltransferase
VTIQKPREIAARALLHRESARGYIEDLLERELSNSQLSPADRGLAQELAYGTVRWQAPLDWLIARRTSGREQRPALRVLLRTGLYQMFFLSRIPDHAAVNETVELARQMGCGQQSGFVNAVLRGCLRERSEIERALAELKTSDLALGHSHPGWLCERWESRLGRDSLLKLLEWNNTPPRTFARVNTLRGDVDTLREQWARERVEAKFLAPPWAGDLLLFEITSHPPLSTLPSFTEGRFYIQDPSTVLAVRELDPQPGETIFDLCAAPGGKTTLVAQVMNNTGRVIAHDTESGRVALITGNCARLGVTNVVTALPSNVEQRIGNPVDRILLDAPCSNTGVMRRRVDLRWRIRAEEIARLRRTQMELLRAAVPHLKPGGTLVYSTCSLEPEENAGLIRDFLAETPQMHLQREHFLTPWEHQVDGAFVARMIRAAG